MMSLKNLSLETLENALPSDLLDDLMDKHFGDVYVPKIHNIGKLWREVEDVHYMGGSSDETYDLLKKFIREFPSLLVEIDNITNFILDLRGEEEWTDWHDVWMENHLHKRRYYIFNETNKPIIVIKRKGYFHVVAQERIEGCHMHSAIFAFFHSRYIPVFKGVKFIKAKNW